MLLLSRRQYFTCRVRLQKYRSLTHWILNKMVDILHMMTSSNGNIFRGEFVRGIHRSPVNSPHKGHWRGTWDAGDLRCRRAHYDRHCNAIVWNALYIKKACVSIEILLKFVTKALFGKSALVRWWLGAKMASGLYWANNDLSSVTHICVIRSQCVKDQNF